MTIATISTCTAHISTCTAQDFNISDHMKGFLVAIENGENLNLFSDETEEFTPVREPLVSQLLSWISEAEFVMGVKVLADDDYDIIDGVNLVELFYLEFFTQNRMEILKYLCLDPDSEECIEAACEHILLYIDVYDNFTIEHVKTAFLSPKHATVEELDDEDIFDNAYFYTAEFSSAMIARALAFAYNKYTNL